MAGETDSKKLIPNDVRNTLKDETMVTTKLELTYLGASCVPGALLKALPPCLNKFSKRPRRGVLVSPSFYR